jgi:hypothetical protein
MDKNGYPTEETLEKIAAFNPLTDNVYDFVEYLCENWVNGFPPRWDKKHGTLQLSTGGWSGCESVITALKHGEGINKVPWFWVLYWHQSRAGGHYWFKRIRPLKKSKGKP